MLKKKTKLFRLICGFLIFLLIENNLGQLAQAQGTPFLAPLQSNLLELSPSFSLPVLRGMRVYPNKPFEFDFVVDSGGRRMLDQKETSLLIKYFLTFLTVPEEDLWVNLSPYEAGRIIPDEFALTDAGNALLEQDKVLKQLSSSLTYPDSRLGKKFWEKVYKIAYERFGTTNLPINTYNKIWIVPDKAIVYDMGNSAAIGETHLKVMLEEDYLALKKHMIVTDKGDLHHLTSIITKEIILPELEKEINEGKNFAPVRQIFYSLILANWFKRALRRNILSDVYVNKKKISGVDGVDKSAKEAIYKQYLHIYKVGAYNYIREDVDPITNQVVPRKYFSGGCSLGSSYKWEKTLLVPGGPESFAMIAPRLARFSNSIAALLKVRLRAIGVDQGSWNRLLALSNPVMVTDAAQLSKLSLSKFTLAVAISLIPFAVGATAHAATITPSEDGKILHVQVDSPSDTFGGILRQAQYKGPLWGENGAVKQVGEIVKDQIPDTHWVYMGRSYDIPAPSTYKAVEHPQALSSKVSLPSPQIEHRSVESTPETPGTLGITALAGPQADTRVNTSAPQFKQQPVTTTEEFPLDSGTGAVGAQSVGAGSPGPGGPPLPPEGTGTLGSASRPSLTAAAPAAFLTANPNSQTANVIAGSTTTLGQQSTQNSTASQVPLHFGKKFYLYTGRLPAISIPDVLTAGLGGYVELLDENKTEYEKGDLILTIKNFELESRIAATQATLQDAQDLLVRLEQANNTQATTNNELEDARKEVQRLKIQLAQDTAKQGLGRVRAANRLTIRDFQVNNGASVREGSSLFSFFDGGRIRLDIYLPISAHSNDFDLTLDGKPVKSIASTDWMPTTSTSTAHLSLIVTPPDPIPQGKRVAVSLKVYSPDKGFNRSLNTIVASGGTTGIVGKIETYRITSTADGSIKKYLAREGDKVKAGQIVAQIDAIPSSYREQLQQAQDQLAIIDQQLRDDLAAPGTVGIMEINRLKAEEFKWRGEVARLQDLIPRLDIRAPKDGVIVTSAEPGLGGVVKSGQAIFWYSTGVAFLGDVNDPNGILLPATSNVKHGDFVLVTTKVGGIRLIGVVTNVADAFSSNLAIANKSVEVKVFDPQHALRTGIAVNVGLLDKKNQEIARTVWSQEYTTQSSAGGPAPNAQLDEMANRVNSGQGIQNNPINVAEPATSFPASSIAATQKTNGKTIEVESLTEIDKRVKGYNLTGVTQRINYLQKQLAEKYPNAKSLSLDFNVYTSGGKTYYSVGLLGQLPSLAVNLATGNAYGAAAPIVFSYFGKIAALVTHEKAKQIEFAKIQTELALLQYQATVLERSNQAKNAGIDLGAEQQNIALSEQFMKDLEKGRNVLSARMAVGVSTEEQLRAFNDKIADAQETASKSKENIGKYTVLLNTLQGQNDLHGQMIIDLPWDAEFPTISAEQENAWITKLVDANPEIQQARSEIAAVKQKIKLQKPKGWEVNAGGVNSSSAINDSITEPAFGGGESDRVSAMNPGLNQFNGITIPLLNEPKKIDNQIIAKQLEKKQAELDLKIRTFKGELATTVSALRELSRQIKEADAAYQNALKWWELKAQFTGTLYTAQDWVDGRTAMNKWALKKIDLKRKYFEAQENLKKLGVLQAEESLVGNKAMASDKAQLSLSRFFKKLILSFVAVIAISVMPLNAQQGPPDSSREYNAWSSRSTVSGPNSTAGNPFDSNPFNREASVDNTLAQYRGTPEDVDRLGKITMKLSSDERQEVFNFMVERHDLRFLINLIVSAQGNNTEVVRLAYQSIGDIFTAYPQILEDERGPDGVVTHRGIHSSSFARVAGYPDQTKDAQKVFLTFIAQKPEGYPQTSLLFSKYWRTDELARVYNKLDPNSELAKLIQDVMVGRTFLVIINSHLTPGQVQNASTYALAPIVFDDNIARGQLDTLPQEYREFFASSGWRQNMGILRQDVLTEAQQIVKAMTENDRLHPPAEATSGTALYPIPDEAAPEDSLRLFGMMDPAGQKAYIANLVKKNNIPELDRIFKSTGILRDPDLLSDVWDALKGSIEGRLLILQDYLQSSDNDFLGKIEAAQDIDTVKQDAKAIKNPAAMRIFRGAVKKMFDRTGYSWLKEAYLDTFSIIEASHSPMGSEAKDAQGIIAMRQALDVMLEAYPKASERDSFISGETVYPAAKYDLLSRIAERLNSLNSPKELEDYLTEQAAASPDARKTIDELKSYRDAFINGDNQEITKGPWWRMAIEWLLETRLWVDIAFMAFGIWHTFRPQFNDWKKRTFGSLEDLMLILDKELLNNKEETPEKIDVTKIPTVAGPLTAWEHILEVWDQNDQYPIEDLLSDQMFIDNLAAEIIRNLRHTPDLTDNKEGLGKNEEYLVSYAYFIRLANKTSNILSDRLKDKLLAPDQQQQRKQYWLGSERLFLKMMNVEDFLHNLQSRANVNIGINEHFHKKNKKEGTNKFGTGFFGFDYQMAEYQKKIGPDLTELMDTGNLIIPGLYNNIEGKKGDVRINIDRLAEVISKGKRFGSFGYAASGENRRISSWISRLYFLSSNILFAGNIALEWARFARFNPLDIGIFLGNLCLTASFYWSSARANVRLAENRLMKEIMIRLRNKMADALGIKEKVRDWKSFEEVVKQSVADAEKEEKKLQLAKEEGEENRRREFRDKKIDEIVLMVEDRQDVAGFAGRRERLVSDNIIRSGVTYKALPWGSLEGDTFLQTLLEIKNGHVKNNMFIFVPKGVKPDDPRIELCIKNLYGAAARMPRGGLVMANAEDAYAGPAVRFVKESDMTFGTTWVNMRKLDKTSQPWMITDIHEGSLNIPKLFKELDLQSRIMKDQRKDGNSSVIDLLKKRGYFLPKDSEQQQQYDLMQQFSASNGTLVMGPRAVKMFTLIAQKLKGAKLKLYADLLIPVLIAIAHGADEIELTREILDYVQAQILNGHSDDMRSTEILKKLYGAAEDPRTKLYLSIANTARSEEFKDFKARAHLPARGTDILERSPSEALKLAQDVKDAAQASVPTVKLRGGIDLNFQPQYIQRPSQQGPAGIQEVSTTNMLGDIKGFNFNIVRFTSQLTVNGAFQLMLK